MGSGRREGGQSLTGHSKRLVGGHRASKWVQGSSFGFALRRRFGAREERHCRASDSARLFSSSARRAHRPRLPRSLLRFHYVRWDIDAACACHRICIRSKAFILYNHMSSTRYREVNRIKIPHQESNLISPIPFLHTPRVCSGVSLRLLRGINFAPYLHG